MELGNSDKPEILMVNLDRTIQMKKTGIQGTVVGGVALLMVVMLMALTGCGTSNSQPVSAEGQWWKTFMDMGYVPIYPPQEDIRVGDLLLTEIELQPASKSRFSLSKGQKQAVSETRYLVSSSRWSVMEVANLLEDEYRHRAPWPKTPDAYFELHGEDEERPWEEAAATDGQSIFSVEKTPSRLTSVAPGITSISWTGAGCSSLVPTEAINLAMGTAWQDDKSVTYRIGSAEEYSLSLQELIPLAVDRVDDVNGPHYTLKDEHLSHLALLDTSGSDSVFLSLVSEVMYMRSLDMTVQANRKTNDAETVNAGTLDIRVEKTSTESVATDSCGANETEEDPNRPGTEEDAEEVATQEGDLEDGGGAECTELAKSDQTQKRVTISGSTNQLDPTLAAFMRAQALNKSLIKGDYDDLPDQFTRFISVTDDSVALRRIWQRGLAIGIKGVMLEVDKYTGEVLTSEPLVLFFER